MAWTTPPTFVDNEPLTAEMINTYIVDNQKMFAAHQTRGEYYAHTLSNSTDPYPGVWYSTDQQGLVQPSMPGRMLISKGEETSSSSWVNLPGRTVEAGPVVTVTGQGRYLVLFSSRIRVAGTGGNGQVGIAVDGHYEPSVLRSIRNSTTSGTAILGGHVYFDNLPPGEVTIRMMYRNPSGSSAYFSHRRLTVIPL